MLRNNIQFKAAQMSAFNTVFNPIQFDKLHVYLAQYVFLFREYTQVQKELPSLEY